MTSHRKLIRQRIAAVLMNNTGAGKHVYASRALPLWWDEEGDQVPAILVYTREESAEIWQVAPREMKRSLRVAVEIAAKANEGLDDTLDDIAHQVERIMSENQTLGGACGDILLDRTEITIVGDGEKVHGACLIEFIVTYYTDDVSYGVAGPGVPPENIVTPFERGNTTWLPEGATEDSPETKDAVSLPQ